MDDLTQNAISHVLTYQAPSMNGQSWLVQLLFKPSLLNNSLKLIWTRNMHAFDYYITPTILLVSNTTLFKRKLKIPVLYFIIRNFGPFLFRFKEVYFLITFFTFQKYMNLRYCQRFRKLAYLTDAIKNEILTLNFFHRSSRATK